MTTIKTNVRGIELPIEVTEALGFTDTSWGNDACDSFVFFDAEGAGYRVWVEADDPAEREYPEGPQFLVDRVELPAETNHGCCHQCGLHLLDGERAFCSRRCRVAAVVDATCSGEADDVFECDTRAALLSFIRGELHDDTTPRAKPGDVVTFPNGLDCYPTVDVAPGEQGIVLRAYDRVTEPGHIAVRVWLLREHDALDEWSNCLEFLSGYEQDGWNLRTFEDTAVITDAMEEA